MTDVSTALKSIRADMMASVAEVDALIAQIDAPGPAPSPDPAPAPAPSPSPVPGIAIANDAALQAALASAKGGETFVLAPGKYSASLTGKHYAREVVVLGQDGVTFGSGAVLKDVQNLTFRQAGFRGGAAMAQGAWVMRLENCLSIWFDACDMAGKDSTGSGYFARTADNRGIRITRGQIRSLSRGVVFYGGAGIRTEDVAFSKIGDDCIDYSGLKPFGSIRNSIKGCSVVDAVINEGSHRDFAQLIGNASVDIIGNRSNAQTMWVSDFGTEAQGARPNQDLIIADNDVVAQHVSTLRILTAGTTGRATNNRFTSYNGNKPLFSVPSSMTKSGNTLDGKPV